MLKAEKLHLRDAQAWLMIPFLILSGGEATAAPHPMRLNMGET